MICDLIVPPGEMEDGDRTAWSTISPARAWSAPQAIGALFASAKNRSTLSAATWRSIAVSRRIAISARR